MKRDTVTRTLMTNLKRGYYISENDYRYKNGKYVSSGKKEHYVDYYIINFQYVLIYRGRLNIHFKPPIYDSYTVTLFKQRGRICNPPFKNSSSSMLIELNNSCKIHLYDYPIQLCGQTYDDMNFGKEWRNGELEFEGNNYGDTSEFYFIGEIE